MDDERSRLRETFDPVAQLYDRARPVYPAVLVEQLAAAAELGPASRVLEIGPGTGQLTLALARTGAQVTAVELGEGLAAVARRNLLGISNARVEVAGFENWPRPAQLFDLVASATAFHWLDATVRVARTAAALRPGGLFARISTHHVAGGSDGFFAAAQGCYRRWDPTRTAAEWTLPGTGELTDADPDDITTGGFFESATLLRYRQDIDYATGQYVDLLSTYSAVNRLSAAARRGLLSCLADLIDARHSGRIVKSYCFELRLARRTDRPTPRGRD